MMANPPYSAMLMGTNIKTASLDEQLARMPVPKNTARRPYKKEKVLNRNPISDEKREAMPKEHKGRCCFGEKLLGDGPGSDDGKGGRFWYCHA